MSPVPVAIVTGGSRGLGLALAGRLAERGWRVVVNARDGASLAAAIAGLPGVIAVPGDVRDDWHRHALLAAAGPRIDLLVNSAGILGPSPRPELAAYPIEALAEVYDVNVLAPLALIQLALPSMAPGGSIVNVTSDAARKPYPGWGGYGSSKAALEQVTAILAAEQPQLDLYTFDPGDMRTAMHQQAFPGEDISDRPAAELGAASLLDLLDDRPPSGRYAGTELVGSRMSALAPVSPREAHEPPEAHGSGRDDVALLVADAADGALSHLRFGELPRILVPGDVLVVNTSATLPAALPARLEGLRVELRLSTPARGGTWVVELRDRDRAPLPAPPPGARVELPAGAWAEVLAPFAGSTRLAVTRLEVGGPVDGYLRRHGHPIRYGYVPAEWPLAAYQTVFALDPGSVEMPSAGRPFTAALVTELVSRGVLIAPVTLHTGLSSPELGEPPSAERFSVPEATARLVNAVHGWGGRVIAVGTTVVRALETAVRPDGSSIAGDGSTSLVIAPGAELRAVDGLLTGWHEPRSTHLQMLDAVAGPELVRRSYEEAARHGYRWHEFGDLHLMLRRPRRSPPSTPQAATLTDRREIA